MILSEDCKKCKYGITVKCKSGDEYICCDLRKCQEEKKKKGGEGSE
jgi:hypothetical protein